MFIQVDSLLIRLTYKLCLVNGYSVTQHETESSFMVLSLHIQLSNVLQSSIQTQKQNVCVLLCLIRVPFLFSLSELQ